MFVLIIVLCKRYLQCPPNYQLFALINCYKTKYEIKLNVFINGSFNFSDFLLEEDGLKFSLIMFVLISVCPKGIL